MAHLLKQGTAMLLVISLFCMTVYGKPTAPLSPPSQSKSVYLHMTPQEYRELLRTHSRHPGLIQIAQAEYFTDGDTLYAPADSELQLPPCDSALPEEIVCLDTAAERNDTLDSDSAVESWADTVFLDSMEAVLEDSIYRDEPEVIAHTDRNQWYFFDFLFDIAETDTDWDEFAVVLYIVVGVAVVAVFIVGGLKILYDIVVDNQRFPLWRDFSTSYTYSENRINDDLLSSYRKYTNILSGRFSLGLQRRHFGVGAVAEMGYLDMRFNDDRDRLPFVELGGFYGLFGPVVRLGGPDIFHLDLEFLNGYSNSSAMGWISKARVTGNFDLSQHFFLGMYVGSLFVDLKETQGTLFQGLRINDDLSVLFGASLGFRY